MHINISMNAQNNNNKNTQGEKQMIELQRKETEVKGMKVTARIWEGYGKKRIYFTVEIENSVIPARCNQICYDCGKDDFIYKTERSLLNSPAVSNTEALAWEDAIRQAFFQEEEEEKHMKIKLEKVGPMWRPAEAQTKNPVVVALNIRPVETAMTIPNMKLHGKMCDATQGVTDVEQAKKILRENFPTVEIVEEDEGNDPSPSQEEKDIMTEQEKREELENQSY